MRTLLVMAAALAAPAHTAGGGGSGRPARLWGVTVDDVTDVEASVASLRALPRRATVRVVFDLDRSAASYAAPGDSSNETVSLNASLYLTTKRTLGAVTVPPSIRSGKPSTPISPPTRLNISASVKNWI